ncbi:hypothetical protein SAMN02745728_02052 [Desulfovibrio litoralis DSM 11393]|uniref:Uncharacterized protein n=1 Tax=Desulfovibrio litoralis DSM 11393 TaxID=1121455 RepID=A0A1M7TIB1_9BACT|nr:hypothetical protein SAMN02745728_02052 [Desulfovibrio litoralis DSM 11393]
MTESENKKALQLPFIKSLLLFIPPPGKIYIWLHSALILQGVIILLPTIYFKSLDSSIFDISSLDFKQLQDLYSDYLTFLGLYINLAIIICSLLCLTAVTRFWRIALFGALLGGVFLIILKINLLLQMKKVNFFSISTNDVLIILFYIYSLLSIIVHQYIRQRQYRSLTIKLFNRYFPFGVIVLASYFLWQNILLLRTIFFYIKNINLDFIHPALLLAEPSLFLCLYTLIIYFIFKQKQRGALICLLILTTYSFLVPLGLLIVSPLLFGIHELPMYFSQVATMLQIVLKQAPLPLFIYYIKTSKEAEAYFLSNSKNNETS